MGKHSSAGLTPASLGERWRRGRCRCLVPRAGTGSPMRRTTPGSRRQPHGAPQQPLTGVLFLSPGGSRGTELLAVVVRPCSGRDAGGSLRSWQRGLQRELSSARRHLSTWARLVHFNRWRREELAELRGGLPVWWHSQAVTHYWSNY